MRTLSTAFALVAAASLAVPAFAQAPQGRASVSYADLDLSSEAGKAELHKRFEQAARDMCGVTDTKALKGRERYCYERTSKQLAQRAATILEQKQAAGG